jgi:hypothetical protein
LGTNKSPKLKVALRGGFSDRNGIKSENTTMQYNSLDERTRTAIVNLTNILYHAVFEHHMMDNAQTSFWTEILSDVYLQQVDYSQGLSYREEKMFDIINDTFYTDDYDSVLTLFEFLLNKFEKLDEYNQVPVQKCANALFEREFVGYRYVNSIIIPITDDTEISSIEEATTTAYRNVNNHLNKALVLISDREHPDYANSIKESISAVEAICSEILGKSDTLGAALKKLEQKGIAIHPCLKGAFDKLYGYTSDATGIRHAGQLDGKGATFDEAKFMLISCSAFINYIKGVISSIE